MKKSTFPVLLAALLIGGLGGATVSFFLTDAKPSLSESGADSTTVQVAPPVAIDWNERLEAAIQRIQDLERAATPIRSEPFAKKLNTDELSALRSRVDALEELILSGMEQSDPSMPPSSALAGGIVLPGTESTPEFKAAVESSLNAIRKQELAKKFRAGNERARGARQKQLDGLQKTLNLSTSQVEYLRTAFQGRDERNEELIRIWESGESSDEQLGQIKRDNHERAQREINSVFTPTQAEQYREQQAARRAARGGK